LQEIFSPQASNGLVLLIKNPQGALERRALLPVRFVPVTGDRID
jgi:hypothetical protein